MIAHFKHWFPSWMTMLVVAVALPLVIYGIHTLDRHIGGESSEQAGWDIVNLIGWWRFIGYTVTSVAGLYYMGRLEPPPDTMSGVIRVIGAMGLVFYIWSPGNTALSPLASVLVLVAYVLANRQLANKAMAKRKALTDPYVLPRGLKFLLALVRH